MIQGNFPYIYENATQTKNGLLTYQDKLKLDSIESNANNYEHPNLFHVPINGTEGDFLKRTSSSVDGSSTEWVNLRIPQIFDLSRDENTNFTGTYSKPYVTKGSISDINIALGAVFDPDENDKTDTSVVFMNSNTDHVTNIYIDGDYYGTSSNKKVSYEDHTHLDLIKTSIFEATVAVDTNTNKNYINLAPYTTKQNGISFDTGTINPSNLGRLNLNAWLHVSKINSTGDVIFYQNASVYNKLYFGALNDIYLDRKTISNRDGNALFTEDSLWAGKFLYVNNGDVTRDGQTRISSTDMCIQHADGSSFYVDYGGLRFSDDVRGNWLYVDSVGRTLFIFGNNETEVSGDHVSTTTLLGNLNQKYISQEEDDVIILEGGTL